jgi:hypothetical protein
MNGYWFFSWLSLASNTKNTSAVILGAVNLQGEHRFCIVNPRELKLCAFILIANNAQTLHCLSYSALVI